MASFECLPGSLDIQHAAWNTRPTKNDKDISSILKRGGEIVILENPPEHEGQLHGGCHKPLLSFENINRMFTSNGFRFVDKKEIVRKRNFDILLARYIKE